MSHWSIKLFRGTRYAYIWRCQFIRHTGPRAKDGIWEGYCGLLQLAAWSSSMVSDAKGIT